MESHNVLGVLNKRCRIHKNGQSRNTGNIRYTKRRKTKRTHNTIYVEHHFRQTNTNTVNKTCVLPQTIGCKEEPQIVFFMEKS